MRVLREFATLSGEVGSEVCASDWYEVSQTRISNFAEATDDHQWIHVDVERARRETPERSTVAHGYLTLSLMSPLFESSLLVEDARVCINYGFNRIRFTAPVVSGERIRGHFKLKEYAEITAGAQLTWEVAIERASGGKPALVAEWVMRMLK